MPWLLSLSIVAMFSSWKGLRSFNLVSQSLIESPRETVQAWWFYTKYSLRTFSSFPVETGLLKNSITSGIDFGKFYFPTHWPFHQFLAVFSDAGKTVSRDKDPPNGSVPTALALAPALSSLRPVILSRIPNIFYVLFSTFKILFLL